MTVTHGFIDESVRSDGWYRLTMVEVSARDLGSVTRALRSMLPDGRQRLHFSSEGDARRRQILTAMTRLPISGTTIGAPTGAVETKNRLVSDVSLNCWLYLTRPWLCSYWTAAVCIVTSTTVGFREA